MDPLVSVLMVTHNHADFIVRAIESVLMQETSFDVELVIGEDASTDGTREIIEKYASTHPGKIVAVLHEKNIGMGRNFFQTLKKCRGKYIALLDGDDRWTEADKLAIQVDFLQKNPGVVACGGNTISESNLPGKGYRFIKLLKQFSKRRTEEYGRNEMIISNRMRTLTVMARAGHLREAEHGISESPVLDWLIYINLTKSDVAGKYINLPYFFGAYNVHSGGVFSGANLASRIRISAEARETITSLTHGRYFGWHFPVLSIAARHKFEADFLERHYRKTFPEKTQAFTGENLNGLANDFLRNGEDVLEVFGFIFGRLYQQAACFDLFTQKIATLMNMVLGSSISINSKTELLGSIGTAWRDTLFYSKPGVKSIWYFLNSPLRKYSGIYLYTVLLVYRQSHIHR